MIDYEPEDTYVDTKFLTLDVLDIIEQYVSVSDENNIYTITNEDKLRSLLSPEQYKVEYMSQGITFYEIKTWEGSTMYGLKGWTGSWTTAYN
jgi:hypothetical protein